MTVHGHLKTSEYLKSYQKANKLIELKQEEIEKLKSLAEKTTQSLSFTGGGGGGTPSSFANTVERILELQEELNEDIKALLKTRESVKATISLVPKDLHRTILYRKYIMGNSFEDIAYIEHYAFQTIKNEHGKAVRTVDRIMNESKV